jgi:hypothetical protein
VRRVACLLAPVVLALPSPAAASDRTLREDVRRLAAATQKVDVQSVDSVLRFRDTARFLRDRVAADRATTSRGRLGQAAALRSAGAYVRWSEALVVVIESTAPGGSAADYARAKDQLRRYGGSAQQSLAEARRLLRI